MARDWVSQRRQLLEALHGVAGPLGDHHFREQGGTMALASDLNPGTSPVLSLRLMMNLGCTLFRLTPEEALAGVTINAAKALGIAATHGSLEVGKWADAVVWDITGPAELSYWLGGQLPVTVFKAGKEVKV